MERRVWKAWVLDCQITIEMTALGADLNVVIAGGEKPHIGSVSMAVPRESLSGTGRSATVSTYVYTGHKDDVIGNMYAETLCIKYNCKVVVTCGIHYDHIDNDGIRQVYAEMKKVLEEIEGEEDAV